MKSLLLKGANWIILIGLALTCYGIYEAVTQRNISASPEAIDISSLVNYEGELKYVTITGGRLDLANTYEYTREKKGKVRSRDFYSPILGKDDKPVYIMQFENEPTMEMAFTEAKFTGLLKESSGLPSDILDAYTAEFSGTDYFMLQTDFTYKTMGERLKLIGIFFAMFIIGIVIRKALTRSSRNTQQETEA
ncbi:hypothetical protein [Aliamphritea ceti]|uniref:hypothetical protein n=1 Tax=Aliamphritea ceti TaxID=1524258 RepID=UPI0021C35FB9|nr:hypothetical protein [Aliamphritea ceti]